MINKILFMLVLFLANTIQTITGFAGNLIAMPLSMHIVGYESAKTVLNIFTLIACAVISFQNRQNIKPKILIKMCAFMLIGMAVGIKLTEHLKLDVLLYLYGIMILIIALKKLFIKKEIKVSPLIMPFVLLAAGIIHGMFVSGGALLVVYAVWALPNKDEFRSTVAPVWVVLGMFLIYSHYNSGFYTGENLTLILLSLVPLFASIWLGNILYKRISQEIFLKITYILLIISGISALV